MTCNELEINFRCPKAEDAVLVYELINNSPPLDVNSLYCNLLHCSHFAETSIAAFNDDKLVGFISAYIKPQYENTLFIWQVAVDESVRGHGVASKMLTAIITRDICKSINTIETTITKSNLASWALFESIAKNFSSKTEVSVMFDKQEHFSGKHETEYLVSIAIN